MNIIDELQILGDLLKCDAELERLKQEKARLVQGIDQQNARRSMLCKSLIGIKWKYQLGPTVIVPYKGQCYRVDFDPPSVRVEPISVASPEANHDL